MTFLLIAALLTQPGPGLGAVTVASANRLAAQARSAPEASSGLRFASILKASEYSALVIRRTAPERAEVHTEMADVWHVLEGSGTLVTGGSLVDGVETEPGEVRGRSIAGGESRRVGPGDFVHIPAGIPHWISKVDGGEIVYVVVKIKTRR